MQYMDGMQVKCPFCGDWNHKVVYDKRWKDWTSRCPIPYYKKTGHVPRYHVFSFSDDSRYEIRKND